MKMSIIQRLAALRTLMHREHLGAFIFPSTDPHNSEYVAEYWKGREWISGFNGSAGTVVVTPDAAALWTDSRYFIAAEQQLEGTGIQLMKLKVEGTPTIAQWLQQQLLDSGASLEVGIDGMVNSCADVEDLIADLRHAGGMTVRTNLDPLQEIWQDRPAMPQGKVELHPMEFAGESATEKMKRIRLALRQQHADGMLLATLDDIAWALNLRGSDVHCNPVFVSYLLIGSDWATLFVDSSKLTEQVKVYLKSINVRTEEYKDIKKGIEKYPEYNILIDRTSVNYTLAKAVRCNIVDGTSPVALLKTIKNETEQNGFRQAMLRDGVAMVKFLKWLKPAVAKGGQTEMSVDAMLTDLRRQQKLFRDISFDTIAAYQEHGAIVHYEATPETDVALKPEGLLLLDSGAQYLDGTTDITRTIALGPVTEEQKEVYTLVLKGHIQLELAKFPDGAAGTQIDALAREAMWRKGMNFLHGTGHGVGSYLNVHEGPHQIRMEWKPTPLRAGMTVTDEPGIYLAGRFGVRIENTLLIREYMETEFGRFLQMEPLTLCPIDLEPVKWEWMTDEECEWLDWYHNQCRERLNPLLDEDEKTWLKDVTTRK